MRDYQLSLEGCEPALVDVAFEERLHAPWSARLSLPRQAAADAAGSAVEVVAQAWLGQAGTLRLRDDLVIDDSDPGARSLQGVISSTQLRGADLELVLTSRLHVLGLGQDHRVFLDQTEVAIARSLLEEWGFEVEDRSVRSFPKRRQCVQHAESTLAFVSRILAEAGVVYQCAPSGAERVVFIDDPGQFDADPTPLLLAREAGLRSADRVLSSAKLRLRRRTETVLLNDWNYEAPSADLASRAGQAGALLEHYRFHEDFRTTVDGKVLATRRLEALRNDARVLTLSTECRDIALGSVVEIEAQELAVAGQWLVVRQAWVSSFGAEQSDEYQPFNCEVCCVRAQDGYRPAVTQAPDAGFTRSVVTGAADAEIHPDDQLRVKLRHHMDRRGADGSAEAGSAPSDQDSAWTRSAQLPMSGSMLIPRVNWEVLCAHWGRAADEPLILGRLVNAEFPPPHNLPQERLTTTFGTRSTTRGGAGGGVKRASGGAAKAGTGGGGGGNSVSFDDTPGKEKVQFKAGKGLTEHAGNDRTKTVTGSETVTIGGNHSVGTGQVYSNTVTGGQTYSVGTRNVSVTANKAITAGAESISVGGSRIFQVGGKQSVKAASLTRSVGGAKAEFAIGGESRKVKGPNITLIGGALAQASASNGVSVAGVNTEVVAGPKIINTGTYALKVAGAMLETYGARTIKGAGVDLTAGALSIKAGASSFKGANVVFKAASITIKAGGATISISPGSVTIDAVFDSGGDGDNSQSQSYG